MRKQKLTRKERRLLRKRNALKAKHNLSDWEAENFVAASDKYVVIEVSPGTYMIKKK